MQTVHKLRHISARSALSALQFLVKGRLLHDLAADEGPNSAGIYRLEVAIVNYLLFATSSSDLPPEEVVADAKSLLDAVSDWDKRPLSAKATHAAQTLIWKCAGNPSDAASILWTKMLQHPVFDSAGQLNKARIGR